ALAWSFHEGKAKAVVGLSGDASKRKAIVADRMVEILFHYADRALKKCPDQGKIQVMEQHFQDMVPVIVDYCLLLQRKTSDESKPHPSPFRSFLNVFVELVMKDHTCE
ncbi:VPS8 isoform 22, partial [Pan troglodytes]